MTALRGMRCGYYPGLSTWVQCNHKSPYKEGGRKVRGREEVTMEAKVREGGGERERERIQTYNLSCSKIPVTMITSLNETHLTIKPNY